MGKGKETDEVMRKLTELLFSKCQAGLEKKGKGGFFFLVLSIYCITNVKKKIFEIRKTKRRFHYGVTLEENYEKLENIPKELCLL